MMKPIGSRWAILALLLAAVSANIAQSAVTATVDRNRISLGDTLRLQITASDDEEITDRELQPLLQDFEILQRSSSSNTSIINGRVSHSRQMTVELAPRREGDLKIPAMQFGQSTTPSLTVAVGPPSDTINDGQNVVFEAEVDRDEVYVQGQILLTLRVQQSINLEARTLSPLKLDGAFIKPLEQQSFQRVINGRPWQVDEVRFAIFPEQSGTLEIPTQIFSGRLERGRRSFFDIGGGGQLVRRTTQPITIKVLPKPESYPQADWLPAEQLTLEETWSTPPEQLRVGESATRTIRLVGEGLQGAQLPPILFAPKEGLKYYPDQPTISEIEIPSGLEGVREDSAALVPTRAGKYLIPEIRIPWWNTKTEQLEYAVLPQRTITATGTAPSTSPEFGEAPETMKDPSGQPAPSAGIDIPATDTTQLESSALAELRLWQALTAASLVGWLITFMVMRRKRRASSPEATISTSVSNSENKTFKQVLAACSGNDAVSARKAIIAWASSFRPGVAVVSLDQVTQMLSDEELGNLLEELDMALYRPGETNWHGEPLAACVRRLRKHSLHSDSDKPEQPLQLYPSA